MLKKVLNMNAKDAKNYFLKGTSYFNLDLPPYFNFDVLLNHLSKKIGISPISSYYSSSKDKRPEKYDNINYKFSFNKDGAFSWRQFQMIHPVLYIELVNIITDKDNWEYIKKRFKNFRKDKNIICCSDLYESTSKTKDKGATISNWWSNIEQRSLYLSLDYNCVALTDITDCYGSIYTHTISWALHGKMYSKENRDDKNLLGNKIDNCLRKMSNLQTNGIPQGSNLMDFIAEIVLGYADSILSKKIKENHITNYKILRYRDDYRIYAMDELTINNILKFLSEVLMELNLKINPQKTIISTDLISLSIKRDKLDTLNNNYQLLTTLQQKLLFIRQFSLIHKNSGSLIKYLLNFYEHDIYCLKHKPSDINQLISIIVDIMYHNTKTYKLCVAILSVLFEFLKIETIEENIDRIRKKFKQLPNTEYLDIWLQRITLPYNKNLKYDSLLCQKLNNDNNIWNSEWLKLQVDEKLIINENEIKKLDKTISPDEFKIFDEWSL